MVSAEAWGLYSFSGGTPKFKAQFSPQLGGCICWVRNPELEVTDIWVGREGAHHQHLGFYPVKKEILIVSELHSSAFPSSLLSGAPTFPSPQVSA